MTEAVEPFARENTASSRIVIDRAHGGVVVEGWHFLCRSQLVELLHELGGNDVSEFNRSQPGMTS